MAVASLREEDCRLLTRWAGYLRSFCALECTSNLNHVQMLSSSHHYRQKDQHTLQVFLIRVGSVGKEEQQTSYVSQKQYRK